MKSFGTMTLPTQEVYRRQVGSVLCANWVKYPDWRACFADRLATLERLSNAYPHYKDALGRQRRQNLHHRSVEHLVHRSHASTEGDGDLSGVRRHVRRLQRRRMRPDF